MENRINVNQRFWAICNDRDCSSSLVMDKDGCYHKINDDIQGDVFIFDRTYRMHDIIMLLERSGTIFKYQSLQVTIPILNQCFVFSEQDKLILVFDIEH